MGSAVNGNRDAPPPSSSSKPPAKRAAAATAFRQPPSLRGPNSEGNGVDSDRHDPSMDPSSSAGPLLLDGTDQDTVLHSAGVLTREEVLRRRSRRMKQLSRYYRDQYWVMMEGVRAWHREYYWRYARSPVDSGNGAKKERRGGSGDGVYDASGSDVVMAEGSGENGGLGFGHVDSRVSGKKAQSVILELCKFPGCRTKAMALTSYCHQHILSDPRQTLYKACTYVIKSVPSGQILCGKPVLRSAVPSLCLVHFQKAQRHVSQALKRAGLSVSSSSRNAPKLHVIVAEYVHQIQAKRKEAQKAAVLNTVEKDNNII